MAEITKILFIVVLAMLITGIGGEALTYLLTKDRGNTFWTIIDFILAYFLFFRPMVNYWYNKLNKWLK